MKRLNVPNVIRVANSLGVCAHDGARERMQTKETLRINQLKIEMSTETRENRNKFSHFIPFIEFLSFACKSCGNTFFCVCKICQNQILICLLLFFFFLLLIIIFLFFLNTTINKGNFKLFLLLYYYFMSKMMKVNDLLK